MNVDARALCKAAGSLKRLTLSVDRRCTSEALAEVFEHRPLEELGLTIYCAVDVEVSSACSPGMYLCGVDSEGPDNMDPLCGFLLFMLLLSTLVLFECIPCAVLLPL